MRVLHLAAISRSSAGIEQQMSWEQKAADSLQIPWTAITRIAPQPKMEPRTSFRALLEPRRRLAVWLEQRSKLYEYLLNSSADYDVLLLRYSVHDPFLLKFLRKSTKPVVLVHHAIEYKELILDGKIVGKIRALLEKTLGRQVNRLASGQIGVTQEILDSVMKGIPEPKFSYVYPNGIWEADFPAKKRCPQEFEFLFVASSFQAWHGLDRLLASAARSTSNFTVHVVGGLSPHQIKACELDSRFKVHGVMSSAEISALATRCSLGISSLAMDRNGLTQGSTLKVREYLIQGLPVVADHLDVFPERWPYFRKIDANADQLVDQILDFAREMGDKANAEVREAAKRFIEKKALLDNLYAALLKWGTKVDQTQRLESP